MREQSHALPSARSQGIVHEMEPEHLYQINHVYVVTPAKSHNVVFESRLFAVFDCWDFSQKVQLGFRTQAMLQLAGLEPDTSVGAYRKKLEEGEIRHPILASVERYRLAILWASREPGVPQCSPPP